MAVRGATASGETHFTYDAFNHLPAVFIDHGTGTGESYVADWRILSRYRYDGRWHRP